MILTIDEASLAIAGGFGKIVLGMDDDASDAYNIDEMDLIAEEPYTNCWYWLHLQLVLILI